MKSLRDEFHFMLTGTKYYIVALIVPVIVVLFFGQFFVNNQINEGKVVVIDLDHSEYSRQLTNHLNESQYLSVEAVINHQVDIEKLFFHDQYLAVISLPQGLEANHLRALPSNIGLYIDNSNFAAATNLRTAITEIMMGENLSVSIPHLQALGVSGDPVTGILSNLTVQQRILFNPTGTYNMTMVMGFLMLYSTIFYCFAILPIIPRLRVQHKIQAELLESHPFGIVSRILPYAILAAIGLYFAFGLLKIFGGFRFEGNALVFLLPTLLYTLGLGVMCMWASWKAPHPGAAMGMMMFIVIPGFLTSNLTLPVALLPEWAKIMSNAFPMVWYMRIVRNYGFRGAEFSDMSWEIGGFLILIGIFLLLLFIRLFTERSHIMKSPKQNTPPASPEMVLGGSH
ncbi:MAG TPA: ABC transporter permease [Bacillota bacterium]|nr:ABC transporter permease [Bacillota bacterium]